ncbi:MAG: hypothetical protein GX451_10480 [Acholeplasmataceae bacterium]|nr:hypothetical protein [Acholeplasmataceae bacterium]
MIWVGRLLLTIGGLLSLTGIRLLFKGNFGNKDIGEVFLAFLFIIGIMSMGVYLIWRAKGGKLGRFAKITLQYILFYIFLKLLGLTLAFICLSIWLVYKYYSNNKVAKNSETPTISTENEQSFKKENQATEKVDHEITSAKVDVKPTFEMAVNDLESYYNSDENLLSAEEFHDLCESLRIAPNNEYIGKNYLETAVISLYKDGNFDESVYYLVHDGWNKLGEFEKDSCRRYYQSKIKESILSANGLENTKDNWEKALQGLDFILVVNPEFKRFINLVREDVTEEELATATEDSFCSGFVEWHKSKDSTLIDNIIRDVYVRTESEISKNLSILYSLYSKTYLKSNMDSEHLKTQDNQLVTTQKSDKKASYINSIWIKAFFPLIILVVGSYIFVGSDFYKSIGYKTHNIEKLGISIELPKTYHRSEFKSDTNTWYAYGGEEGKTVISINKSDDTYWYSHYPSQPLLEEMRQNKTPELTKSKILERVINEYALVFNNKTITLISEGASVRCYYEENNKIIVVYDDLSFAGYEYFFFPLGKDNNYVITFHKREKSKISDAEFEAYKKIVSSIRYY